MIRLGTDEAGRLAGVSCRSTSRLRTSAASRRRAAIAAPLRPSRRSITRRSSSAPLAELADVTGYHRNSIYRAIESGALAAAKPRGRWLIAGAAINAPFAPPTPGAVKSGEVV